MNYEEWKASADTKGKADAQRYADLIDGGNILANVEFDVAALRAILLADRTIVLSAVNTLMAKPKPAFRVQANLPKSP